MKKILALLLSIMLLAGIASAEETQDDFLGKPFPDFTVTDTDGNSFTLSEALKDHDTAPQRHTRRQQEEQRLDDEQCSLRPKHHFPIKRPCHNN